LHNELRLISFRHQESIPTTYVTSRLQIDQLSLTDAAFIMKLVNTSEWIRFIGDRDVHTIADAERYVKRIIENPVVNYYVVKLSTLKIPIGIITVIARDYLDHPDLGFAFLPEFSGKGFAYEASKVILTDILADSIHETVLAITVPDNARSVQLLEKLGFRFTRELERDDEVLSIYSVNKRIG